ncbi:MAG TPA: SDR family oxidoreductase [Anaerolineae bacterium]|nr:SDR family oxidoreductase [Anaerolineae bacterium]HOQ99267.1 SDR family oxidoreductase [Anaerolineae bacterium]HPL26718.1 SDR family oxidoreductase [Anaerolineae bacterium]
MGKPISDQVVVITGASSGVGRETALRCARKGATVVITARNEEALRAVNNEIAHDGSHVMAIPADMADWHQVQRVAQQVVERFGRIDTWVNNAAVGVYGTFSQVPVDEFRRVMDVNLLGQVYGAKAALPHLKKEGGTLIGIGASSSLLPTPLQSAYTASAFALKGLYDTLRLEQQHERSGVNVSLILPSMVDTPFFEHAKTYLGVKPAPFSPVYEAGAVADAILHAAQRPVRDLNVGAGGLLALAERIWPRLTDAYIRRVSFTGQLSDQPKSPSGPNNLWRPVPGPGAIGGGYRSLPVEPYSWIQTHPAVRNAVAGVALSAVVLPAIGLGLAALVLPAAGFAIRRRGAARFALPFAAFAVRRAQRRACVAETAAPGRGGRLLSRILVR